VFGGARAVIPRTPEQRFDGFLQAGAIMTLQNQNRWSMLAACCAAVGGVLIGCERHRERVVVHEERPDEEVIEQEAPREVVIVERRPERTVVLQREEPDVVIVQEPPRPRVIVERAPPRVIVERHPPRPSGLHVWVNGYWSHDGNRFVWTRGHYEKRPSGYRHVDSRWVRRGGHWELHEGYWSR
jgi:hypothetical protein